MKAFVLRNSSGSFASLRMTNVGRGQNDRRCEGTCGVRDAYGCACDFWCLLVC